MNSPTTPIIGANAPADLQGQLKRAAENLTDVCARLQQHDAISDAAIAQVFAEAQRRSRQDPTTGPAPLVVVLRIPDDRRKRKRRRVTIASPQLHVQVKGHDWFIRSNGHPRLLDGPFRTRDAAEQYARLLGKEKNMRVIVHRKRESLQREP